MKITSKKQNDKDPTGTPTPTDPSNTKTVNTTPIDPCTNYLEYFNPQSGPGPTDIKEMFLMPESPSASPHTKAHLIGGWKVLCPHYDLLGAFPGATQFVFSFGLQNVVRDNSDGKTMVLVAYLTNTEGTIQSQAYLINTAVSIADIEKIDTNSAVFNSPPGVAFHLAHHWITDWTTLSQESTINNNFCHIKSTTGENLIKSYVYDLHEMLNTLHFGNIPPDCCSLYVYLVNHKHANKSTIGIMCSMVQEREYSVSGITSVTPRLISYFYDFSAPCPPTCPPPPPQQS